MLFLIALYRAAFSRVLASAREAKLCPCIKYRICSRMLSAILGFHRL